jgi:hypothetical protein
MKALKNLALAAVILMTAAAAQAEWVSGHFRSNGTYVQPYYRSDSRSFSTGGFGSSTQRDFAYRNPYAATPSVQVDGYFRQNGTYIEPHYRTPANGTITDNLNYRGYGTIRVPRNSYGW